MTKELEETLKTILAEDAFNWGNMQVSKRVCGLAKAINYLTTQIHFVGKYANESDMVECKEYVYSILESTNDILKETCLNDK